MGNCTSKVSAGTDVVTGPPASATKAAVVATAEVPAETPPETVEQKSEATAAVAPPAPTPAPPLPARPVKAAATPERAGETATSTPPPAVEEEKEAEVAGETATSSPPPPEKVEETVADSPDPPVDVEAAEAPDAPDEATDSSPTPALEPEPEKEGEAEGPSPPAPVVEPEKPEEASAPPEPPVGEEEAQQEEQPEEQQEEEPKQFSYDEWVQDQCKSMKYIPRKGSEDMAWEEVYPPQKDLEKPVTQCCVWMGALSAHVLMAADLGGGTLFDWWNTHIGQGEAETDLTADELFERAVAGLKATIFPEFREALEAGAETAVTENLHLKATLKNCFDAPAPPEGTTGGEDGESYPEPHSWVAGGYMYGFGPSHITSRIVSKDRKYIVGDYCTREELEKALGRSVEDGEVEIYVEEQEEEGDQAEQQGEQQEEQQEEQQGEQQGERQEEEKEEQPKQLSFDEWLEEKCKSMKYIPRKGSDELAWDVVYPPQKDLEKPVTQCCAWMGALSAHVLMAADLGGGTLFDWWNTHIGQGEAETDLTADELFERAVAGLKATIFPEFREALEAGAETAVAENLHLKATLKNCFDAPAPPEGTTGGEDGESYPEPHAWVAGGYMYGFGPSHITTSIISKDRKYVVGSNYTREEVEKALGRSLEDSEVDVQEEEEF